SGHHQTLRPDAGDLCRQSHAPLKDLQRPLTTRVALCCMDILWGKHTGISGMFTVWQRNTQLPAIKPDANLGGPTGRKFYVYISRVCRAHCNTGSVQLISS